jgi:ribulose-phosphate 3-epimerase
MPIIAPSLLSADFLNLQKDCDMLNASQADWFHLDVMDGSFVPNISFGFPVIERFARQLPNLRCSPDDCRPGQYAEAFQKAGAHNLTVHYEACPHLHRNLQQIKSLGMQAGVALNPHTPVHLLSDILHDIDLVCLMSVNPGFGGQQFIPYTLDKIVAFQKMIT